MTSPDVSWQEIRDAVDEGNGVTYIRTEAGGKVLNHVVMTRARLEALLGHDPGHDEEAFPHSHVLVSGR